MLLLALTSHSTAVLAIRAFYSLSALLVAFLTAIPSLRSSFIPYGKTLQSPAPTQHPQSTTRHSLHVPKRWFTHFYMIALPWSLSLFLELLLARGHYFESPVTPLNLFMRIFPPDSKFTRNSTQQPSEALLCLFLMVSHAARRLYESIYVFTPSCAKMHVFHYVFGLAYYAITPIALCIEALPRLLSTGKLLDEMFMLCLVQNQTH